MEKLFTAKNPDELGSAIDFLLLLLKKSRMPWVIALKGDLGAGKTTFVQELAKKIGLSEPITSPTFTIAKQYAVEESFCLKLLHIDLYRIDSEVELAPLKFGELIGEEKTLSCVEWPERAPSILPENTIWVEIEIGKEEERRVLIRAAKER